MRKKVFCGSIVVILCTGISLLSYRRGRLDLMREEFKVYEFNLIALNARPSSLELQEYLKGRYYFLGNRVAEKWLPQNGGNYGPVSSKSIPLLGIGKGPTTPEFEYKAFVERLNRYQGITGNDEKKEKR